MKTYVMTLNKCTTECAALAEIFLNEKKWGHWQTAHIVIAVWLINQWMLFHMIMLMFISSILTVSRRGNGQLMAAITVCLLNPHRTS